MRVVHVWILKHDGSRRLPVRSLVTLAAQLNHVLRTDISAAENG